MDRNSCIFRTNKKKERGDDILSLTIASSISDIIKFSADNDFRELSFKALGVSSTKGIENEVYKKFLAFTENPKSFTPQTVAFDHESESQSIPKSFQTNLSQSLSQSEENLSQTILSQISSQILQEQKERRLRQNNIILSINSGIYSTDL